ncbi:Pycsar system effector family protein [Winogradskyella alexanderae]|uniref:DUF5706 domain-containing protein n=1 Tax=Winogradskyella alexanderae TaxID=2877123 RepID=A0ABS7XRU9_9FLAO|nr:Pycsar system effector family protein [Winogradskyella alexanderae]MCA0132755.1 DUF5706 domain-containing protein [Winogradskyella alexanderae]
MAQDPNNYWEQLERLEKLIKNSELKAGVVFSFHSLIIGIFIDRIDEFKTLLVENSFVLAVMILWALMVTISIFFCFRCFKPVMEMKYERNVFFFRDAVNEFDNVEEFCKEIIKVCGSKDELYQKLAEQIHAESKIIDDKFKSVRHSITFFALSILFVFIFTVYLSALS